MLFSKSAFTHLQVFCAMSKTLNKIDAKNSAKSRTFSRTTPPFSPQLRSKNEKGRNLWKRDGNFCIKNSSSPLLEIVAQVPIFSMLLQNYPNIVPKIPFSSMDLRPEIRVFPSTNRRDAYDAQNEPFSMLKSCGFSFINQH